MTENSTKITKKPATSVKKNSSVKGSSKNKKRKKKRNNIGIIFGTAAAAIVIVVGGGYFIGRAYYSNRFLSGTTVNGIDVGGKTFEQACDLLGVNDMPYELTVKTIDGTPVVFKTIARFFGRATECISPNRFKLGKRKIISGFGYVSSDL